MNKFILKEKSRYCFIYERHNEQFGYDEIIEIGFKNTWTGYKGIQVTAYQKGCNTDGFNNAVGLRKHELLRLPFMIAHFMVCRRFVKKVRSEVIEERYQIPYNSWKEAYIKSMRLKNDSRV